MSLPAPTGVEGKKVRRSRGILGVVMSTMEIAVRMNNVQEIVSSRLCLGCGACAYICPDHIKLVDFVDEGIRPVVNVNACVSCTDCLAVCPGFENDHTEINRRPNVMGNLTQYCGPVLEIWEGFARSEIRFAGASGAL